MQKTQFAKTEAHWRNQAAQDAKHDVQHLIFDGHPPHALACDTTLREMPDGSWIMVMLGGGQTEPLPANRIFLTRSVDDGVTWSPVQPIDLGIKSKDPNRALTPSELMLVNGRCTLVVATHSGTFADWRTYLTHSDDACRTWSPLIPAPGRTANRTFIRNHIVTQDGRIIMPYQHYLSVDRVTIQIPDGRYFNPPRNPRNGVIISLDGGETWSVHGDIRLTDDDNYHGWAENNIVALSDGTIQMLIRGDRLGGVLYAAQSSDGGYTWPKFAHKTTIPNPGSKVTLYSLDNDVVAILHNPNPSHRSPLALWISFDGMKTWPYKRVLVDHSIDDGGNLNYPDGFVSQDGKTLHFAFDDNRHRAVYYGARLPDLKGLA